LLPHLGMPMTSWLTTESWISPTFKSMLLLGIVEFQQH
jgi:hypothetical protein